MVCGFAMLLPMKSGNVNLRYLAGKNEPGKGTPGFDQ
jgi:hypothetical protein